MDTPFKFLPHIVQQPNAQHINSFIITVFFLFACLFVATLTYDTLRFGEFEDFPETSEPVWILGKEYNALTGGTLSVVCSSYHFSVTKIRPASVCFYFILFFECRERRDSVRRHVTAVVHVQKKLPAHR